MPLEAQGQAPHRNRAEERRRTQDRGRRIVNFLSIAIAAVAIGWFCFDRFTHQVPPIWVDAALTFGGVYCLVMFMNSFGHAAAQIRGESDEAKRHRPVPVPPRPGQGTVVPVAPISADSVQVERVSASDADAFQEMVDEAVQELLALESQRPHRDSEGHVTEVPGQAWLGGRGTTGVHVFWILQGRQGGQKVGFVVLESTKAIQITMIYVVPGSRRKGIGRLAIQKVMDFARLITSESSLVMYVGKSNMRGRRFLERSGFTRTNASVFAAETSQLSSESEQWSVSLKEHDV